MISIVIPLYNKADYLFETLQSIRVPADLTYEILVVDDASTDASLTVAQQFHDPHLRLIQHATNQGLSAARNTGIAAAKYDYIAFLDADDTWHADFLPTIISLINQYPQAGLWATAYWESYEGDRLRATAKNLHAQQSVYLPNAFDAQRFQPLYCFSSVVVHQKVFKEVGGFDPAIQFAEDVDFNLRALAAFGLAYSPHEACYYRTQLPGQITYTNLAHKGIPNFDKYEPKAQHIDGMKAYIDANRYFIGLLLKKEGEITRANQLWQPILSSHLTWKMRVMMQAPNAVIRLVQAFKQVVLKWGVRLTTYS